MIQDDIYLNVLSHVFAGEKEFPWPDIFASQMSTFGVSEDHRLSWLVAHPKNSHTSQDAQICGD